MTKRKRKSKNRRSEQSDRPSTPSPIPLNTNDPPRKTPIWMWGFVLLLLSLAIILNWRRAQQNVIPLPLPLPSNELTARPLLTPSVGGKTRFAALGPTQTGIEFTHPVYANHPMAYLYFSSTAAGGTAIGDVNGDGRPDIFVASGPDSNRLYLQKEQPFTFEDATRRSGVGGRGPEGERWGCGATMVDINADGRLDIFVANYDAPNQLFVNRGNGTFVDRAFEYGLNLTDASLEGTFQDYDRDGLLDMYLVTYRYENPEGMPSTPPILERGALRAIKPEFRKYYELTADAAGYGAVGRSDGLLRNNGDGTFIDVTSAAGVDRAGHGQAATWFDFNDDGFVDLHVGNDFSDPDPLYRNNGDGTFTDIAGKSFPHITWFSMGADAGDLNGDGLIDLLSADMSSTTHFKQKTMMGSMGGIIEALAAVIPRQYMRNALLINTGKDRFQEAAYFAGLDSTDWTWSVNLVDLDCDGRQDAFFTNGSVRKFMDSDKLLPLSERKGKTEWELYKDTEPLREENLAFRNEGELKFRDVSAEWGLNHLGVSMSSAHGDLDNDGDLDLVVANIDQPLMIYRNDSQEHRRMTVRLHGQSGNRYGIGANLRVTTAAGEQVRELQPSRGFLACNQPIAHFGCGTADVVDLRVAWPSGGVQNFTGLKTGHHYEIVEPQSGVRFQLAKASPSEAPTLYTIQDLPSEFSHRENEFDDFALQPLLPHRMSRLGPAIAAGDANGDGVMDYFFGGGAHQPGRVALGVSRPDASSGKVPWQLKKQPDLDADRAAEDMGAVWVDVDQDGDVDLFVASGGNESAVDAEQYLLRLYLNDGQGNLKRSRERLPDVRVSAGPVAAADFDKDGDVDVFVGGRQVPGKYPLPAKSHLLVNEEGVFSDRTTARIQGIDDVGMVTGALWSDVDNDQDLDLLLTTEWGSIRLFRNHDGKLSDDTADSGLSAWRGWWTGIVAGDLDRDGDMDYVVGNLGKNTKYHASESHPFRIFYGDFERNGERKLVEAEYENETLFPMRGKSCSTHAMPSLAEKFPTYKDFALATLQDIYTPSCLEEAYECSATELSSVALLNDGTGHFRIKPLPVDAQLSPVFGAVITELNGDGIPDVFLVQNFFSPQLETGNMDGGLGCMLAGRGDGAFDTLAPRKTGVVIPEDATAAILTDGNDDQRPDFLVATNNGSVRWVESHTGAFSGAFPATPVTICVRLSGVDSSARVAGTRVQFRVEGEPDQIAEISAGSGYLSQQPPICFFALPANTASSAKVVWPDGRTTTHEIAIGERAVSIVYPAASP